MKKNKLITYKNVLLLWGLEFMLCIILFITSFFTNFGKTFFAELIVLNVLLFVFVLLFKNKIKNIISLIVKDFDRVNDKSTRIPLETWHKRESVYGLVLLSLSALAGVFAIFWAVTDAEFYRELIRENGVIEGGSAIMWLLAAIVLTRNVFSRRKRDFRIIPYIFLILFFILCGGEETSWGQRLFHFDTPEFISKVNVQDETNIHNIGSISVFSNLFFIFSLAFFILIPILTKKYGSLSNYLKYYSFPEPNRFAVYVFLSALVIWLIIGIRFGTLGFHPFSIYPQNYYTQMDDEIFEYLAAYSFLSFSIMDGLKKEENTSAESTQQA